MSYQTTVRLPPEIGEALEQAAEATGRKVSELVREAISAHVGTPCKRCHGTGFDPGQRK